MMLLPEFDEYRGTSRASPAPVTLPETRPSVLDPNLECEPWIDVCHCEQLLILFLLNRPIALMPGSSLDHVSLNMLLNQIRHRTPRQHKPWIRLRVSA